MERVTNLILTKCMLLHEESQGSNEFEFEIYRYSRTLKLGKSINEELDYTPRQIGLAIIDRLLRLKKAVMLPLIKKLLNNVISGNLDDIPFAIKDNIVSILIGMPDTIHSAGIKDYQKYFEIYPVIEWIDRESQGKQDLKRRFPVLIGSWFELIDTEFKERLFQLLMKLVRENKNDRILQYLTFCAIRKFIEQANSDAMDFSLVFEIKIPIIMSLISQLVDDDYRLELVECVSTMILKMVRAEQLDVYQHFNLLDLEVFLSNYSFRISCKLFEIVKKVILIFNFGFEMPELYSFGINLLKKCLPHVDQNDDSWIHFCYFLAKEIPRSSINKGLIDELALILKFKAKEFAKSEDYAQNKLILTFLDEMILLLQQNLPLK